MKDFITKYQRELFICALGILSGIIITMFMKCSNDKPIEHVKEKVDTLYIHSVDTLYIPKETISYKEVQIIDTLFLHDTILLREQKEYNDEYSTIWISGIEPELDSIKYSIPKDTLIIDKEIERIVENKKKWCASVGVGIYAGYGIALDGNRLYGSPEIGVGLTVGFGRVIK